MLYDGREWRIHYWLFRKDKILGLVKGAEEKARVIEEDLSSVYDDIPDNIWELTEEEEEEE